MSFYIQILTHVDVYQSYDQPFCSWILVQTQTEEIKCTAYHIYMIIIDCPVNVWNEDEILTGLNSLKYQCFLQEHLREVSNPGSGGNLICLLSDFEDT